MLARAPAWQPPTSPLLFAEHLSGSWLLNKQFDYKRGGKPGSFSGRATFERLPEPHSAVLAYYEEGVAKLGDDELVASRRLLYDCSGDQDVRVLFDEAVGLARDSPDGLLKGSRFFHAIPLPLVTSRPFEHPCGPDFYRGWLELNDAASWRLTWTVEGPRKQGSTFASYRRAAMS